MPPSTKTRRPLTHLQHPNQRATQAPMEIGVRWLRQPSRSRLPDAAYSELRQRPTRDSHTSGAAHTVLPVSNALIGFLGVIAGAVVTGGVQAWANWSQRHLDGRASARIVWGALTDTIDMIEMSRGFGGWGIGAEDLLSERLCTWGEQRIALARVVSSHGYRVIEEAFIGVRHTRAAMDDAAARGVADRGFALVMQDQYAGMRLLYLKEASTIAFRAGQGRWDRLQEPRLRKSLNRREVALGGPPPRRIG